ncbi:hypothetical protein [Paenibacillus macquariensis]|uniref:Uncharacterized protein n=1 Tax=Paenibacillus macquariensis TaxID=948756 RepID=A0ABY1JSG0_9BACL|nr:hypothetical protein [Paenibacillus macquariensis]MEC0092896.1 hypothetical protein [Paenibacillus macquariensis]OAB36267.1 hypothetical protein PMSM_07415 [Paenibacillus macquariensis subsp. macquariensis]SIQ68322.1 hypothetical protein SAMN05421578_103350 [Paenibacillus macquariensis]
MSYEKIAPDWKAKGIEPPQSKRETGWEVEDRPPAAWLNWFMNLTAESLHELQTKAAEKTYVDEQIREAISDIGVTTEKVNTITPKLVIDTPGTYPIGITAFSLSITLADPWKIATGHVGTDTALVQTVKISSDYLIVQRITFDNGGTGIRAVYERSSQANNAWKGAWVKVVSRSEFETLQEIVVSHKADNAKQVPHLGTTTNLGNAYSVTTTETIAANQKFTVKVNAASTGVATLNVSSIGSAKGIKKPGGTDATLKVGVYTVFWDGTSFQLLGEGGEYGTAIASQVLSPHTIGTENGIVTGTMPDRGLFNLALGASVPAGYYSGGNAPSGKKFASGVVNSSADTKYFYRAGLGDLQSESYIMVSGLTFKPSLIFFIPSRESQYAYHGAYHESFIDPADNSKVSVSGSSAWRVSYSSYVNATGFTLPIRSGLNGAFNWYAFE